jgi:hypothetical protein
MLLQCYRFLRFFFFSTRVLLSFFYGGNTQVSTAFSYGFRQIAIVLETNKTFAIFQLCCIHYSGRTVAGSLLIGCVSRKGRHFRNDCWPWVL